MTNLDCNLSVLLKIVKTSSYSLDHSDRVTEIALEKQKKLVKQ